MSKKTEHEPNYYVAIGASAGGLEALQEFFHHMPEDSGAAFIVIQHLSPDFKSMMDELLARRTKMKIYNATDSVTVQRNTIYLIPPSKNMMIAEGKLLLADQMLNKGLNFPIDIFFRSLAEDQHHRSIAIVLSGTGSDGSSGLQAVKEVGGLVIVQEPSSAKFDGMPYNAVKTGAVDVVTAAKDIPATLVKYITHPFINGQDQSLIRHVENNDAALHEIFALLKECSDIDFALYKATTVIRRIERRIGLHNFDSLKSYYQLLIKSPQEIQTLAKDMLIGVTRFFRDTEAFATLEKEVIPSILDKTPLEQPIRVWVAGCSTGEEAYSIAILLDEAIKHRGETRTVKIFATDVDPDAITEASSGQFSLNSRDDISETRLNKYFIHQDDHLAINSEIRKMVVFATHNLIKDPPFSNTQLAVCRNVLIYFQPKAQRRVLSMLHFSIQKNGYLFLGGSESLGEFQGHFEVVQERSRIYQKVMDNRMLSDAIPSIGAPTHSSSPPSVDELLKGYSSHQHAKHQLSAVLDLLVTEYSPPCIILNDQLEVIHIYGDVSLYTKKLTAGRFSSNIHDFITDQLSIAASTALHRALKQQGNVQYDNIHILQNDKTVVIINLHIRYIKSSKTEPCYLVMLFENIHEQSSEAIGETYVYNASDQSQQRIHDLENELKKNKEHLQITIEELETTNEELQSSNEELMASNEELQSTNEELQSVNEELYTVNSEYQEKNDELSKSNTDLDNIIKSTHIGIVFLDEAMLIRNFTPASTKEINLLPTDIGRPFHHIAHNLIYDALLKDIAEVIEQSNTIEKEIKTTEDKTLILRITPYFGSFEETQGCVISFTDITEVNLLKGKLNDSYQQLRATLTTNFINNRQCVRLLVIDDEQADRALIHAYLNAVSSDRYQFDIHEAENYESAQQLLKEHAFDVCLIDYRLGDKTAFEVIELITNEHPAPAFIMLSAIIDESLYASAMALGIYDAIDKSVLTPHLLERSIRYTIRHKEIEHYLSQQH